MVMTIEFPHKAPEGYRYEYEDFKRNVISIWIWNGTRFDYNGALLYDLSGDSTTPKPEPIMPQLIPTRSETLLV
jgi:hypothetical protein